MDTAALRNQAQAFGRGGIWFAAGVAVGAGYIHGDSAVTIVGAVLAVLGGGWTTLANTNSSITQAASQIPAMKAMAIADVKLAAVAKAADPETKVVFEPPPKEEK